MFLNNQTNPFLICFLLKLAKKENKPNANPTMVFFLQKKPFFKARNEQKITRDITNIIIHIINQPFHDFIPCEAGKNVVFLVDVQKLDDSQLNKIVETPQSGLQLQYVLVGQSRFSVLVHYYVRPVGKNCC